MDDGDDEVDEDDDDHEEEEDCQFDYCTSQEVNYSQQKLRMFKKYHKSHIWT